MRYFTSDQHYGHEGIISLSKRPFSSVEEMDIEIIRRHNSLISPNDEVFHLGDFTFKEGRLVEILKSLNGKHHLVSGNHDKCHPCHHHHVRFVRKYLKSGFSSVQERLILDIPTLGPVLLCHLPMRMEGKEERYPNHRPTTSDIMKSSPGEFLIHGHVHKSWTRRKNMINVGVDVWNFSPVAQDELVEFIHKPY